jgi:RNA ligase (TIGR02306 family)
MRKLASIRKILELNPIEGADKIEVATIDGWRVVVKKGEFKVGDLVVYFEIDSWIPMEIAPFLVKGTVPREFEGVKGERLRTVTLRGQVSQGLVLPISILNGTFNEGDDVTDALGIKKYEKPLPAQLAGVTKGYFPSFIRKTDEERIQNLVREFDSFRGLRFEVTEKLDGSSMTVYRDHSSYIGVCSRNLDLKETEDNTFWLVAKAQGLIDLLKKHGAPLALQGELVGEGINGNRLNQKGHKFYLFNIWDICSQKPWSLVNRLEFATLHNVEHVPFLGYLDFQSAEEVISFAEGKSIINPSCEREGIVFKCVTNPEIHFKAISTRYLLKFD